MVDDRGAQGCKVQCHSLHYLSGLPIKPQKVVFYVEISLIFSALLTPIAPFKFQKHWSHQHENQYVCTSLKGN